jgi:hypothetical protein
MRPFGIFYLHFILWPFGIFVGHLVHFSHFGMLFQEKSGNPAPAAVDEGLSAESRMIGFQPTFCPT